jgi:hypothetical protein
MSNTLYTYHEQLHPLIQAKAEKFGIEINIQNDFYYYVAGEKYPEKIQYIAICNKFDNTCKFDIPIFGQNGALDKIKELSFIQAPQIRQILLAFREVLGVNPEYNKVYNNFYDIIDNGISTSEDIHNFLQLKLPPKTKSDALCAKWLDGLTPLFDTQPELVLSELLEVLKAL